MNKRAGMCMKSYAPQISINAAIRKPLLLKALYIEPTNPNNHSIVLNPFLKPKELLGITKWCFNHQ